MTTKVATKQDLAGLVEKEIKLIKKYSPNWNQEKIGDQRNLVNVHLKILLLIPTDYENLEKFMSMTSAIIRGYYRCTNPEMEHFPGLNMPNQMDGQDLVPSFWKFYTMTMCRFLPKRPEDHCWSKKIARIYNGSCKAKD